jgi:hypothetical protein
MNMEHVAFFIILSIFLLILFYSLYACYFQFKKETSISKLTFKIFDDKEINVSHYCKIIARFKTYMIDKGYRIYNMDDFVTNEGKSISNRDVYLHFKKFEKDLLDKRITIE